jgi:hypothetical protein
MMRSHICLFLPFCFLFFIECRRTTPSPGQGYSGTSLVKTVTIDEPSGSDSVIFEYGYDTDGKLVTYTSILQTSAQPDIIDYSRYYRDDNNRIYKIAEISNKVVNGVFADTIFTFVSYLGSTATNLAYAIRQQFVNGEKTYDSSAFMYDPGGNLIRTTDYSYPVSAPDSINRSYYTWTWDADHDLTQIALYNDPGNTGNPQLNLRYQFSYDSKVNPLDLGDDILLETIWGIESPHNTILQTDYFPGAPSFLDGSLITTYAYRSNNRPDSSTLNSTLVKPTKTIYYYH